MEPGSGRKRPWEEENTTHVPPARPASTSAPRESLIPPLPQRADWYARDSQDQGHRRLPPLYTPSCAASAEHGVGASSSSQASSQFFGPVGFFDVFQPKRQRLQDGEEPSITYLSELESNQSLRPLVTDAQHFRFGADPAPHAAGAVICCNPTCSGQTCSKIRTVVQKLASELIILDSRVRSILHSNTQSLKETPEVESVGTEKSLQWALDLVQWTNLKLQDHTERLVARAPEQGLYQSEPTSAVGLYETMKRRQENIDREEHSPSTRPPPGSLYELPRFPHPARIPEDNRRSLYSSDLPSMSHSPHRTASSGSIFIPPQSPLQASQTLRSGMLPSPSSMNFPTGPNLPPISPPSSSVQTSAQAVHFQDLQHQVSIKTLAFQTLQREYDSLLQKLERQRTKCATLEKKFEVSDVEINTLTDEREKLQAQIAALESHVEELQKSRDEARRQLSANGAQYMRIMEMASRLQAQGAEDKKRWEAEKVELERRIKLLEEAMVTGGERPDAPLTQAATEPFHPTSVRQPAASTTTAPMTPTLASSAETIAVLRAEIARLRSRTQSLETALQTMKDESISIQAAAQTLVGSGRKVKDAVDTVLGE
ncbi:uncharacterized protein K441DRAFT_688340 [Cenococcum geophilum 1.58]|uniref:uncharacterized protein n=1 Tax=Cenococcum geophilum 1.58 TaxID=794803 RepID=UPI00358FF1E2|nr:hypothetical protein K441DRAFT_688340 [Cenococcum geophilum 1.58]